MIETAAENILFDTVRQRIFCWMLSYKENILLDTVQQRIFCWILSGRESFGGHCPTENIFFGHYPAYNIGVGC